MPGLCKHSIKNSDQAWLVLGLGVTGTSVLKYLTELDATVYAWDEHITPEKLTQLQTDFPRVAFASGDFPKNWNKPEFFKNIAAAVLSPGIALNNQHIKYALQNLCVISDFDLFFAQVTVPVLAITGTNGKSTVTSLLSEIAKAAGKQVAVGGNLGVPVLDLLHPDNEVYILEASSFQLQRSRSFPVDSACILNFAPDHLDQHASLQEYYAAKQQIYNKCSKPVVNFDQQDLYAGDPANIVAFFSSQANSNAAVFGIKQTETARFLCRGTTEILNLADCQAWAQTYPVNLAAAAALAYTQGWSDAAIASAAIKFKGLPHRCEFVLNARQIEFYNDSKATNPASALASANNVARNISGKIIWLLGGDGKGVDFSILKQATANVRQALCFGQDGHKIAKLLSSDIDCVVTDGLRQAFAKAIAAAKAGDAVLLAPACASWDQFDNYMQRGDLFKRLVLDYSKECIDAG